MQAPEGVGGSPACHERAAGTVGAGFVHTPSRSDQLPVVGVLVLDDPVDRLTVVVEVLVWYCSLL